MNELTIFIFDAKEGMELSRDVILNDGSILLTKGTVLNLDLISRISGHHILEISVYDKTEADSAIDNRTISSISAVDGAKEAAKAADDENTKYYETVRNSEEFKTFEEHYNEHIDTFKDDLKKLISSDDEVNTKSLVKNTIDIVAESNNSLQLFDMLHAMRDADDLTYVHSMNVALIASVIGKWIGYNQEKIKVLTLAGLMHDIGKLLIPEKILNKPGNLTDNEYEIMKKHVNLGYEQVKNKFMPMSVKEAILLHHEKCDGTGYPFGLKSDKIPETAKIIAIADVYDAMTSSRIYRAPICPFEVVRLMYEDAFTKFDPVFAIPFLKNVASSYIHTDVRLSDGRVGKVILINDSALHKPVVQVDGEYIDLSKKKDLNITALL